MTLVLQLHFLSVLFANSKSSNADNAVVPALSSHSFFFASFFAWVSMRHSFVGAPSVSGPGKRTRAFMFPWRACRWFLRNFGSVPFRDGYRDVFGFLMLPFHQNISCVLSWKSRMPCGNVPIPMRLP